MNKKLLFYACALVFFIWLVNTVAHNFYWYSAMWWFDIPMHILGGMFLAICAGALFFKKLRTLSRLEIIVTMLLFVFIIGVGWELFEYGVQTFIKGSPELANISDSIKDILMDIIGGVVASFFVLRSIKRYNKRHDSRISGE